MSYCLNPNCTNPQNPAGTKFCLTCGSKVRLKERYRTVQPLGQGGFGRTFLAVDEDKPSHPPCVIKQFFPQAQGTSTVQKAAQLFTQEAVRLDELGKHPQIPELLAYFCQDSHQYLVQEFIEGEDLAQELARKGAFTEAQVRDVLNNLLPVLQFVHQHHVIHRDIKPENIIRRNRDKQLFLVDFGASKVATGTALARTGTVIGSVGYVAPEQSIGKAVFASDIYSLGVTCIHLLTGIHPFDLFDVNQGVWIWRQGLKNPVSDRVAKILDKMLVSATNQRYQSVAEILQDLQSQTPVAKVKSAKPAHPPASAPMKPQPNPPQYGKGLDKELADLKSEFLQPPTSKSTPPKSTPPTKGSANTQKTKSQMDRELEEIKSQFLEE
ncbi:protein kinase domain-containing protein [Coleofasciculus sp. E1-EBD-02]|jgi:serine/threonine protein kinase|uniref:protein kinase domain-containing protein n=1 Tax=Coleofasciculus sp. E1-EBD-02 TaxID=3068481 RepID=UPI0032F995C8